jgi:hypothetical protein
MATFGRGLEKAFHDVQYMEGQITAGTVRASEADAISHVGSADTAADFGAVGMGNFMPGVLIPAADQDRATKGVGIGHAQ